MPRPWPDPDQMPDAAFERLGITRERFREIRRMIADREKGAPPVGSEAPDFELELLDDKGGRTAETLRLASLRGRPVALVFGSYT